MVPTIHLGRLGVALTVLASAALCGPTTFAHASTAADEAAAQFGLTSYSLSTITASGDISTALSQAAAVPGTVDDPHLIYLPAGEYQLRGSVRVADRVYLAAESGTTVTLAATADQMLWFPASVTAGVYGGAWDAQGRGSASVFAAATARLQVAHLTLRNAGKHGVAGYRGVDLSLTDVTATANKADGVHLDGSRLTATDLTATANRRNGIQLSAGSSATITGSILDANGLAVRGSTTGKTGHGLGLSSSSATVIDTSISANKVCGISSTGRSVLSLSGVHADRNGRHGLGTSAGTQASISNTTFLSNGYNGVLATGSGTVLTLTGVQIADSRQYGISLPGKGTVTLSDTSVVRSGKSNIAGSGKSRLTLQANNLISAAKAHGVALASRSTLSITGTGNQLNGNAGNALMLSDKGTSGRIIATVSYQGNRGAAVLVRKKARLYQVPGSYSANRRTATTSSGGKIITLH